MTKIVINAKNVVVNDKADSIAKSEHAAIVTASVNRVLGRVMASAGMDDTARRDEDVYAFVKGLTKNDEILNRLFRDLEKPLGLVPMLGQTYERASEMIIQYVTDKAEALAAVRDRLEVVEKTAEIHRDAIEKIVGALGNYRNNVASVADNVETMAHELDAVQRIIDQYRSGAVFEPMREGTVADAVRMVCSEARTPPPTHAQGELAAVQRIVDQYHAGAPFGPTTKGGVASTVADALYKARDMQVMGDDMSRMLCIRREICK